MIKANQVPKEASTAVDDLFEKEIMKGGGPTVQEIIAVAVNAWPRMTVARNGSSINLDPHLILPLPQESGE